MIFFRYLVLLLWVSIPTYAQSPADTILAHQYYQTADSLSEQGKYGEANDLFRQAQKIYRSAGDWEKYIACLNSIANNLWPAANYDSAISIAQLALQLSEKHLGTDHPKAAQAYDVLGIVQEYIGKYQEALNYYQRALRIRKKYYPESDPQMASSYQNLGICHQQMGKYDQALTYYQKVLAIQESAHPVKYIELANIYNHVGMVHHEKGNYQRALQFHQQALAARKRIPGRVRPDMAASYTSVGIAYEEKGAYNLALRYYEQSLHINQELFGEIHPHTATDYNNIGVIYSKQKNHSSALQYHEKSLKIRKELYGETHSETAISHSNLGMVYFRAEDYDKALFHNRKAISIRKMLPIKKHRSLAISYGNIGNVFEKKGEYSLAYSYYRKALSISERLFDYVHPNVAHTYNKLGSLFYVQQNYDSALSNYRKSFLANNAHFSNLHLNANPDIEHYLNGKVLLYTLKSKAETLSAKKLDSLALATYWLADSLVDQLRQSYLVRDDKISLSYTAKQTYEGAIQLLLRQYHATRDSKFLHNAFFFSEKSKEIVLIESIATQEASHFGQIPNNLLALEDSLKAAQAYYRSQLFSDDSSTFHQKLFLTTQRYDSLVKMLEAEYPNYYQLKYATRTATVSDIQTQLAPDEAVISYFIGDSSYYAFTITPNQFWAVPLPIDTLLSERVISIRQMLSADSVAPGEYQQAAYELYQQLLTPVVADSAFASVRKLTIIPDGVLGYLPFELLLTQPSTPKGNYATLPYLLQDYTIHYSYSATWLFHPSSRPANPVTDQYIAFAPHYPTLVSDSVQRLAFGRFRDQVAPLRWNQQEVKNINQHLSGVGYAQGAAVERCFKEEASQYSVIHLAMHALVDDQNPMYSRFVFSEDTTDTQEDGYLNAYELYNMELPAELAVLSACETGYGKLEQGEGIMSLARAFAYAGCPSIVMSHWLVDDKASAQLMDYFYRYLSQGLPKDEALQQAKLTYLETASVQKAHPFFWGNFVLMGNADPIVPHKAGTRRLLYATGGLLLLLGLVGITYRYRHRPGVYRSTQV